METTISRTWKPTTAGILNIISGVLSLLGAVATIIGIVVIIFFDRAPFLADMWRDLSPIGIGLNFLIVILVIIAILSAVLGVLPLLGGIFALQRRRWGWALTGSIAAIFGSTILGILATIFTAMSKDEFE
ncbi:hypothetical protein ACFLVK_01540 [Chloroflexota bacterium]